MKEQEYVHGVLRRVFGVFKDSQCEIRPHSIICGPTGSGKSHLVQLVAKELDLALLTINAAGLTKEGVSGNSLSKALSPLRNIGDAPAIVFCDEFDKLFVAGSAGSETHESLAGVQNEFLTVLENDQASVFGDYGKYVPVPVSNCLFVFAGAFNGEKDMSIERLKELGVRNEFLGRVSLCFSTEKPSLESLMEFLNNSDLLAKYMKVFPKQKRATIVKKLAAQIEEGYTKNTLGVRGVNSLIHQHFLQV